MSIYAKKDFIKLYWKFYDLVMVEQAVLKTGDTGLQYLVDKLDLTQAEQEQLSFDLNDPTINEGIKRNDLV